MKYLYSLPKAFVGKKISVSVDILKTTSGTSVIHETANVKDSVAVLPIIDNEVVLLRCERPSTKEVLIEVPSGSLSDVDHFKGVLEHNFELEGAKRELQEKTGYEASHWECLGQFYTSPGWSTEKVTLFLAYNLLSVGNKVEQEHTVITIPFDKAMSMITFGSIKDIKTVLLLHRYALSKMAK